LPESGNVFYIPVLFRDGMADPKEEHRNPR
jgi:hypothetical protein